METKKCPYCGEDIPASAKKCMHCGMWLEEKASLPEGADKEHGAQTVSSDVETVQPKEQVAEDDSKFTSDEKLYFIHLLATAGIYIFGYFIYRSIYNTVMVTNAVDGLESLGGFASYMDVGVAHDDVKHVIKAFHGLMRNGIIISVVGEVISILVSLMSKTKD